MIKGKKKKKMANHILTVSDSFTSNLNHQKQFIGDVERYRKKIARYTSRRFTYSSTSEDP